MGEKVKGLEEKALELIQKMKELTKRAEVEQRAFTDEESSEFDSIESQISTLNKTIENIKKAKEMNLTKRATSTEENVEEVERRAFESYLRSDYVQERASNLVKSDNGAVIPNSIAKKIINKVVDICPIYNLATRYNIPGTLSIPYYDEDTQAITMAYATEFTDLTSNAGKFLSIEMTGFLAGAFSKISKSLINNSGFDIVSFVVSEMAEAIRKWIEKELLNGTSSKIEGLNGVKVKVTAASQTAVTSDELIDLQESIQDVFQENAIWIMSKETRRAIRKLKDNDGNYLLNRDVTAKWGHSLLGKDVYVSENMPKMAAGKTAIYYGDMSGLAVKVSEDISIELLKEAFAVQHAVGVVGWVEIDSKVENAQKIAKLVMKS